MLTMQFDIWVDAPRRAVFEYLSDLSKHPEWATNPLHLSPTSDTAPVLGSTYASVGHQLGRDLKDAVTVSEFVPDEAFSYDSIGDLGDYRHFFRFKDERGGTRICYGVQVFNLPWFMVLGKPVLWTFFAPLALKRDLKRIKARLEPRRSGGLLSLLRLFPLRLKRQQTR